MTDKKERPFTCRVDSDLRESFLQVCEDNDTTGSREVRRFMREYVKKNGQLDLLKKRERK